MTRSKSPSKPPAWAVAKKAKDAARNDAARAALRDVTIPDVVDRVRRERCLADPYEFLTTYFPRRFRGAWTADRRRIVEEIVYRAQRGGQKALAAPRGEGKTSIAESIVGVYAPLAGLLRFPVIIGATSQAAAAILANIKSAYERNDLLLEDFPEICAPIRALEGSHSRCLMQTVGGKRTFLRWSADCIVLPTVEGSIASGAIIASRSIDGAIRGLRVNDDRPDFALVDDPETRESSQSPTECTNRERTIEEDVGGLGGEGKPVSLLVLTTVMSLASLSYRLTDRKQKPAFDGERMSLVQEWPTNAELWDKYVELRKDDHENGEVEARRAHQFYLDNRTEMDAGAVVSNPERFDPRETPDGSPREVSAIQQVFNQLADKGRNFVLCELQNDPPSDENSDADKLTVGMVRGSAAGYSGRMTAQPAGAVPNGSRFLTAFIDLGDSMLTWQVSAWLEKDRCVVVDYGKQATDSRAHVGVDLAITRALGDIGEHFAKQGYQLSAALVDSGFGSHAPLAYRFVKSMGLPWFPSKGDGRYAAPKAAEKSSTALAQFHWTAVPAIAPQSLVVFNANYFKRQAVDALRLPPIDREGGHAERAVRIFGVDPMRHTEFATEVTNERFIREFVQGKGYREAWDAGQRANHWFDTHVGNYVALAVAKFLEAQRNRPRPRYGVLSKGLQ